MYLAVKGNAACRIPESHAAYYKELGYSLTDLNSLKGTETEKTASPKKEDKKPDKD